MGSPSRAGEVVETEGRRYKIVELPVDPPNTTIRKLVPIDTNEEDVPVGGRLLNELETQGILARSSRPENILVGDMVRMKATFDNPVDNLKTGTVEAALKSKKVRVRWDDGSVDRHETSELAKVY